MMVKISGKLIGSGKLPNKYYVSWSNNFWLETEKGIYDWASEDKELRKKIGKDKGKMVGVFNTFEEALWKAHDLAEQMSPDGDIRLVTIEDHISGEVYMIALNAKKTQWGLDFHKTEEDETKFTREKLGDDFR